MKSITMLLLAAALAFGADHPPADSFHVDKFQWQSPGVQVTLTGATVTRAFFESREVLPLVGRHILPQEYQAGKAQVVWISYRVWQDQLKADLHIVGKVVQLNGHAFTVIGIMPQSFAFPSSVGLWVPKVQVK
jgi:hypothetical protein